MLEDEPDGVTAVVWEENDNSVDVQLYLDDSYHQLPRRILRTPSSSCANRPSRLLIGSFAFYSGKSHRQKFK